MVRDELTGLGIILLFKWDTYRLFEPFSHDLMMSGEARRLWFVKVQTQKKSPKLISVVIIGQIKISVAG